MDLNIRVLGSTSSGNCTVIWDSSSAIMIDCGFSPRYTSQNLEALDLDISSLSGVLITHTHSDHVKRSMLKKLVKEQVPVFCHDGIREGLVNQYRSMRKARDLGLLRTFGKEEFLSGPFRVRGFEVPHDSTGGCFGFN
ncbi:MAG TPA: MBL fold metallo-hydrolase, partial [Nitrospirae bacterium]|nr:MBL fold metallo-hydrolase [Nitrospirota bacterium]